LPHPIAAGAFRVRQPAGTAGLEAPTGIALRAAPGLSRAVSGAVDLAAITTASDDRLGAAAQTQE